jgi:hypothetical protein
MRKAVVRPTHGCRRPSFALRASAGAAWPRAGRQAITRRYGRSCSSLPQEAP